MLPNLSDSKKQEAFWVTKVKIICSIGTYIRSIARKLEQNIKSKSGAILLGLKRTKVGYFKIKDSLRI